LKKNEVSTTSIKCVYNCAYRAAEASHESLPIAQIFPEKNNVSYKIRWLQVVSHTNAR